MTLRTLLALAFAALAGAASSQAFTRGGVSPCNGQKPCISMRIGSAYAAKAVNALCLYNRDFEQKPQIFCGPAKANAAVYVSFTVSRIEVTRISGSKIKTLYSIKR